MIGEKETYELFRTLWKARMQQGENDNKYRQQLKELIVTPKKKKQAETYYTDRKGNRRLMVMMFPFL